LSEGTAAGMLLTGQNDDILTTVAFIAEQPLERMDALKLDDEKEEAVFGIVRAFAHEYLELGTIKSERMLYSRELKIDQRKGE